MEDLPPEQCRTEQPQVLMPLLIALLCKHKPYASTIRSCKHCRVTCGTPRKQCASRTSCSTEIAKRVSWLLCIHLKHTNLPAHFTDWGEHRGLRGFLSPLCQLCRKHPRAGVSSNAIVLAFSPLPSHDAKSLKIEKRRGHSLYSIIPEAWLAINSSFWRKGTCSEKL